MSPVFTLRFILAFLFACVLMACGLSPMGPGYWVATLIYFFSGIFENKVGGVE
jgi:hypothetical protein